MPRRLGVILSISLLVLAVAAGGCTRYGEETANSAAKGAPKSPGAPGIGLKLVAEGFASPLGAAPAPDGSGRLFIFDQVGVVWVLPDGGKVSGTPFLDLRDKMVALNASYDERGLLGLAFHPAFRDNKRFFVYYSAPLRSGAPEGWNHTSHLSEFRVGADPDRADAASEKVIMRIDQPQANHNGGQIAFGPDGFLYIPLGDGGGANDVGVGHSPQGNGQDIEKLLGKILRIDVNSGEPYGVPPDNPFIGKDGLDEIYAFGFRNPFRISFDSGGNRELYVADVGQRQWEEVDIVEKGKNYGWNLKEGTHAFDPKNPEKTPESAPANDAAGRPLVEPVIEYKNSNAGGIGTAVIGGFVYRGSALPQLQGAYIFGDYTSGRNVKDGKLFMARRPATPGMWQWQILNITSDKEGKLNAYLRSFGEDSNGELYVLTADEAGPSGKTGKVLKIVP